MLTKRNETYLKKAQDIYFFCNRQNVVYLATFRVYHKRIGVTVNYVQTHRFDDVFRVHQNLKRIFHVSNRK